jgi:hypothetical protein
MRVLLIFAVPLVPHQGTIRYGKLQQSTMGKNGTIFKYQTVPLQKKLVPNSFCEKVIKVDVSKKPCLSAGLNWFSLIIPHWRSLQTDFPHIPL